MYIDKNNIIRVLQLRIGKKLIDRPIQLTNSTNGDEKKNKLNSSAAEFGSKRTAAKIVKWRLKDTATEEDYGDI